MQTNQLYKTFTYGETSTIHFECCTFALLEGFDDPGSGTTCNVRNNFTDLILYVLMQPQRTRNSSFVTMFFSDSLSDLLAMMINVLLF